MVFREDYHITEWLDWFLGCLGQAIDGAETILEKVFVKARFWEKHGELSMNSRQRKMLNRLLDDFKGKLTSSKWAKMQKCSPDTALRDINELISHGILAKEPSGGRSTNYALVRDGS